MSIVKSEKVCYNIDAIKEEVQSNGQIRTTQIKQEEQSNVQVNRKDFSKVGE